MDSRLSRPTQSAVTHAREEAQRLGSEAVGTEHLLLGLLAEPGTSAARLLIGAGATLDGCRSKVVELTGPAAPRPRGARLELTDRARRTLERAERLSLRRRAPSVEPEHVLVSLLDVEGRAGQVLRGTGVDVALLRQAAAAEASGPATAPPEAGPAPEAARAASGRGAAKGPVGVRGAAPAEQPDGPRPRCVSCGGELTGGGLAHMTVESPSEEGGSRPVLLAYCATCGAAIGALPGW